MKYESDIMYDILLRRSNVEDCYLENCVIKNCTIENCELLDSEIVIEKKPTPEP